MANTGTNTAPVRTTPETKPVYVAAPKATNAANQGAKTVAAAAPTSATLTSDQQSSLALMTDTLRQWGLDALVPDLQKLILQGDTNSDTLALALSQTDAYKQRFAGNAIRAAKGLPELTPAQYIATEESYKNVMQSWGIPSGYYDNEASITQMIGNDLSPSEVDARAKIAHDQYLNAPDDWKKLWQSYGFTNGDAIASILDPNVATQIIQDRAAQVSIGGAAADQGFAVGQQRAQQFYQNGVTLDKARAAYAQIAQSFATDQSIASRFHQTFGQAQEENDLLLNQGAASNERQSLYDEEKALFRTDPAQTANSLGVSQGH